LLELGSVEGGSEELLNGSEGDTDGDGDSDDGLRVLHSCGMVGIVVVGIRVLGVYDGGSLGNAVGDEVAGVSEGGALGTNEGMVDGVPVGELGASVDGDGFLV
jgi:hypothetical protein